MSGKPAWFSSPAKEAEALGVVRRQLKGISESIARSGRADVVLAGVSQGGAMALQAAPQLQAEIAGSHPPGVRLVGVLAVSAWLPAGVVLANATAHPASASTSPHFLLVHAKQDEVVPISEMHDAKAKLLAAGIDVAAREFDVPGGHSKVGKNKDVTCAIGDWFRDKLLVGAGAARTAAN